ncbi:MAG: TetR/AcrR family transcriptional regulator [Erysipelotrichaceae bacterium]
MDRRQQKSRKAIMEAFNSCLEHRSYAQITVHEIIDLANVGRSTFYAHFETKEALLAELCREVCSHVFLDEVTKEATHDFRDSDYTMQQQLTHIFIHLQEKKRELTRLLKGESQALFFLALDEHLEPMVAQFLGHPNVGNKDGFTSYWILQGFHSILLWWVQDGMQETAQVIAQKYEQVLCFGILNPRIA